ncbi:hypothetical protein CCHL11_08138 [Colletotrichum chlorophyti]|uniref:Rhodopsin domain-containing protein n=1 Tax=Colletotrichum chlorophyti TaxID=708187 RepID=A0A1Q8S1E1_9PEZI|nr:hypothetical protein CCHL11_08138 [Colletotrichum chlorophyti]
MPNSSCLPTDSSCLCADEKLNKAVGACLAANCTVIESLPIEKGFGQDIWMLPPDNITQILFIFFVDEILYAFVITMTKVSIILFYLRIFREPWFRKACYTILVITLAFGVWHVLQIIFVSWPISYSWTFWDGEHVGTRGNVAVFSFVNSGINIALDICLCFLPVTQLQVTCPGRSNQDSDYCHSITMSWTLRTKIGTSLIFLLGLIV